MGRGNFRALQPMQDREERHWYYNGCRLTSTGAARIATTISLRLGWRSMLSEGKQGQWERSLAEALANFKGSNRSERQLVIIRGMIDEKLS